MRAKGACVCVCVFAEISEHLDALRLDTGQSIPNGNSFGYVSECDSLVRNPLLVMLKMGKREHFKIQQTTPSRQPKKKTASTTMCHIKRKINLNIDICIIFHIGSSRVSAMLYNCIIAFGHIENAIRLQSTGANVRIHHTHSESAHSRVFKFNLHRTNAPRRSHDLAS